MVQIVVPFESRWLLLLSPCSFEVARHFQAGIPFDLQCLSLAGRGFALTGLPILGDGA